MFISMCVAFQRNMTPRGGLICNTDAASYRGTASRCPEQKVLQYVPHFQYLKIKMQLDPKGLELRT